VAEPAQPIEGADSQQWCQQRSGQPEDEQERCDVRDQQMLGHVGRELGAGEVEHRGTHRQGQHGEPGAEARHAPGRYGASAASERAGAQRVRDGVGGEQEDGEH
jgi:hypothetical protein